MTITFEPKKVLFWLAVISICLILANVVILISTYGLHYDRIFAFDRLFNLDEEHNIPTLFSGSTMLLCSVLMFIISAARKRQGERDFLHWTGLAIIFVFLSADETLALHENIIRPLRNTLHTSGFLYFAWVIPYGILTLALFIIYLKFLISLPPRIRILFIAAGIIYVTGALGFEILGGYLRGMYEADNIRYAVLTMFEESLEMTGILIFIYALMSYIDLELKELSFKIGAVRQ